MIVLIKFIKKYAKQDVNNFVILIYNKIKKIKHDDVYHGKIVNCEDFRHSHNRSIIDGNMHFYCR